MHLKNIKLKIIKYVPEAETKSEETAANEIAPVNPKGWAMVGVVGCVVSGVAG